MEKIKIELSKINSETVKFGKNKVLVLPIISTFAKIEIIDICLQQFRQNNKSLPLIKTIYDIAILGLQTNVDVPEFEEINDGNNREIKIKLNSDIVYNYETSGIFDVIKDAIYNYRETWEMIINAIQIENTKNAFENVVNTLPDEKSMNKSIEMVSKFAKENPDFVKAIAKEQVTGKIKEVTKEEVKNKYKKK